MRLPMLEGRGQEEATEVEVDHLVRKVRGRFLCRRDAQQRKYGDRQKGGDRQRKTLADPPDRHPERDGQHIQRGRFEPARGNRAKHEERCGTRE